MNRLPERIRNLQAITMEHMPGAGGREDIIDQLGRVVCDRCGHVTEFNALEAPPDLAGWGTGPEGDLCPECAP